jgi:hypothetical protein
MLHYPDEGVIFALYRGAFNGWDAWLDVNDESDAEPPFRAPPTLCFPEGVIGRVWRVHNLVSVLGFALDRAEEFDGRCEHHATKWILSDKMNRRLDLYEKDGIPTTWVWMGMMGSLR